jgi:uncharacterized oligopeptide transporter (OPT) family protein
MADHQSYVPASQAPAELTPRAVFLGVLLGLVFGASNVYLALKIGLTVSASIPIAVLAITIFRAIGRATILENTSSRPRAPRRIPCRRGLCSRSLRSC